METFRKFREGNKALLKFVTKFMLVGVQFTALSMISLPNHPKTSLFSSQRPFFRLDSVYFFHMPYMVSSEGRHFRMMREIFVGRDYCSNSLLNSCLYDMSGLNLLPRF